MFGKRYILTLFFSAPFDRLFVPLIDLSLHKLMRDLNLRSETLSPLLSPFLKRKRKKYMRLQMSYSNRREREREKGIVSL